MSSSPPKRGCWNDGWKYERDVKVIRGAILFLLSPMAFGQPDVQPLQPGRVQIWAAQRAIFDYGLPDPVGGVRVSMSLAPRTPANASMGSWAMHSLEISYHDVSIELPGYFLACLPHPQPYSAKLSTVFIEPSLAGSDWLSEFTSYVTIPFGSAALAYKDADTEIFRQAQIEFAVTGHNLRRIVFIAPSGERRPLSTDMDSCPAELIAWALE